MAVRGVTANTFYGVADVYGQCEEVTIVPPDDDEDGSGMVSEMCRLLTWGPSRPRGGKEAKCNAIHGSQNMMVGNWAVCGEGQVGTRKMLFSLAPDRRGTTGTF